MTQQHRICIDLPNTAVGQKIDENTWCHGVYTMFPGNMTVHYSREHDAALMKPGNTVYFCTSYAFVLVWF